MKTDSRVHVGIDLGATFVKLALVTDQGSVLARDRFPTEVVRGAEAIISEMATRCCALWEREGYADRIDAVGVGSPGPLDPETGFIPSTPNLKWEGVPLKRRMEEHLGRPVVVENDAVAATFGEWWTGAGRSCSDVVGLTLGTGVGGGIVLQGRPHRGFLGSAGHIGHAIVAKDGRRCDCGNRGCLEAYASATAIVERARERIEEEDDEELRQLVDRLTSEALCEAAREGNALAREIFRETAHYLAAGIQTVMNILNPQAVIIMGGVARAADLLMQPLEAELERMIFGNIYPQTRVVLGALGHDAGVVGAAGLARLRLGRD